MCFYYDDYAELWNERICKARKTHRCDCCRQLIASGERYRNCTGMFEGAFFTTKECRRCLFDIARIVAHELDEGCGWQEAWPATDDVWEYLMDSGMGQTPQDKVPAWFELNEDWPHKSIERLRTAAVK